MRYLSLLGLAVFVVLPLACGGSSSSDAPSKAEFLKKADQICFKTDSAQRKDFEAYARENRVNSLASEEKMIAKIILPSLETEVRELEELTAPAGDEQAVNTIISHINEGLDESKDHPQSLNHRKTPLTPADELAAEYGLKACAEVL